MGEMSMLEIVGGLAGLGVVRSLWEKVVGQGSGPRTPSEPEVGQSSETTEAPIERTLAGKVRRILDRYDLRRITPRELLQLARELRECGVLNEAEFSTFVRLKFALEQAGVDESVPVDVVEFCRRGASQASPGMANPTGSSQTFPFSPSPEVELIEKLLALAEW